MDHLIQKPKLGGIHITLTYAQSLDGFIGKIGSQLLLSGPQSKLLTHNLRNRREAIMVGIGTILNDDPLLTTRLDGVVNQPIPVILDTNLQTPNSAKCLRTDAIIICNPSATNKALEQFCRIIRVPHLDGKIDLKLAIQKLESIGIKSIMIEGGSKVIQNVLQSELQIDEVIVTIAPVYCFNGVHSTQSNSTKIPIILDAKWHLLGTDCILTGRINC